MKQNISQKNTAYKNKINIDVVSGFSGAGKTTWLNKLSSETWTDEKTVFLQNEFGQEALEMGEGIHGRHAEEIRNGCICCSGSTVFTQSIYGILQKYGPDRIVIELSETARLEDVIVLVQSDLKEICRLDHITYILSLKSFRSRMLLSQRFLNLQLQHSPVCLLTRTEEAAPGERERAFRVIEKANAQCTISDKNWDMLKKDEILDLYGQGKFSAVNGEMYAGEYHIMHAYTDSFVYKA